MQIVSGKEPLVRIGCVDECLALFLRESSPYFPHHLLRQLLAALLFAEVFQAVKAVRFLECILTSPVKSQNSRPFERTVGFDERHGAYERRQWRRKPPIAGRQDREREGVTPSPLPLGLKGLFALKTGAIQHGSHARHHRYVHFLFSYAQARVVGGFCGFAGGGPLGGVSWRSGVWAVWGG
jgi:hypothetical protein